MMPMMCSERACHIKPDVTRRTPSRCIHHQIVTGDPGVEELLDDRIDSRTRLHQEEELPRRLDRGHQVRQDCAPDQSPGRIGMLCDKPAHALRGAVEHRDREPMVGHIAGQVLSHDGQTNYPDVRQSLLSHTLPSIPRRIAGLIPAP
jgi:hypothetical protein